MTPANLLLETATRAARTLSDPAPLLAACRAAAEAVRAAFDHPEEPGGALAMDLERLLGHLAMLATWRPDTTLPIDAAGIATHATNRIGCTNSERNSR